MELENLENFLLKYFERIIDIVSKEPIYKTFCGFIEEIEKETYEEGITKNAAVKLCKPLYYRLAFDVIKKTKSVFPNYYVEREALFEYIEYRKHDEKGNLTKWKLKEETKNLTKEEKKKIVKDIIEENKRYYEEIIKKFNLKLTL